MLGSYGMPADLEQLLKDLFGEPLSRLSQYQSEQMKKLQGKLQELAREAVKDELTRLHSEVAELRARVATLESERAQAAADSIQSSF